MTDETIVAVFDTTDHARAAHSALVSAGVPQDAISLNSPGMADDQAAGSSDMSGTTSQGRGFWAGLFGGEPEHDTAVYDRSLQGGSSVISVRVPAEHATRVTEILEAHHPVDLDERATGYGLTQETATGAATAGTVTAAPASYAEAASTPATPVRSEATRRVSDTDTVRAAATTSEGAPNETLQLAEEQLAVGKRVVNRGGTRIRRYVVETPVEENVSLHTEHVSVERHPVADGRPVTADSFTDKTVEMTESSEEAVVSKTARVVEEINLRKEVSDRVETVRDTVRKDEAEVVQVPGTERGTVTGEGATTEKRTTPVPPAGTTGDATVPPRK